MDFIKSINLFILLIGMFLISLSLHLKQEGKNLKYGWRFGWAENLTTRGRIFFFVGLLLALIGAGLGGVAARLPIVILTTLSSI